MMLSSEIQAAPCPMPRCDKMMKLGRHGCPRHWGMLPGALRDAIMDAARRCRWTDYAELMQDARIECAIEKGVSEPTHQAA